MPQPARRLEVFTESVIREMTRLSNRHGSINLAQGFPDFDPPVELVDALATAIRGPFHQYAVTWGAPRFRQALARKHQRFTGLEVDPDRHLVVTCGSTEAMMVSMMTACDPGDKVIVFSPFYENYAADAILSGAVPVHVPLHAPDFSFDRDELRRAFAAGAKAIVICNPSNPSGKVFTREELLFIAGLAEEFDAFVLMDEVYEHIVYAPHRHTCFATLPGMWERTLSCGSLSKTYSITGWRLGHVIAPENLISRARKVHDFLTVGAAAPLQEAAVTALEFVDTYYAELQQAYDLKKDLFLGFLRRTGLKFTEPQGAYYTLLDISPLGFSTDTEAAAWMTREVGVTGVPGSSFFREPEHRYIRLHFAKKEETLRAAGEKLVEGLRRQA
jgi:aspartate/methionine/tyrosine aminotransferase